MKQFPIGFFLIDAEYIPSCERMQWVQRAIEYERFLWICFALFCFEFFEKN